MSDYPQEFHDPAANVESIGPFRRWPLVVNGYSVPNVECKVRDPETVEFVVDNRLAFDVPVQSAGTVAHLVANAIAVAMGYAHHPNEPFAPGEDEPAPPRRLRPWRHYVGTDQQQADEWNASE